MITFDFKTYTNKYISSNELSKYDDKIKKIKNYINNDISYFNSLNGYINEIDIQKIKDISSYIKNNCDVFIIIGIGGSYMGSKAVIEALTNPYQNNKPEIIYLGTNLDSNYYNEILEHIQNKEIIVNVISKSGNTLETSVAFDIIKELMNNKYNKQELEQRIIITTSLNNNPLHQEAIQSNYKIFSIPTNIGGRFSVFTAVGLLPLCVAGIDIDLFIKGITEGFLTLDSALEYSLIRHLLYKKNKIIESFTVYSEKMSYLTEWLKQLMAETQGKDKKGILPIASINTRDLHSLGQFFQEGNDIIFETVILFENKNTIPFKKNNMNLNDINILVASKVALAHYQENTPSNIIILDELNEFNLGLLMQFYIYSSIIGALLLDVNPFDQPGVEKYKDLVNTELKK